jgi:hypothetical protein
MMAPFCFGLCPAFHAENHSSSWSIAYLFPMTSEIRVGLYFSVKIFLHPYQPICGSMHNMKLLSKDIYGQGDADEQQVEYHLLGKVHRNLQVLFFFLPSFVLFLET